MCPPCKPANRGVLLMGKHSVAGRVDRSTLAAFERDGAIRLEAVIADAVVAALRDSVDAACAQSENYFRRQRVWEYDPVCRDYCLDSAAAQLAAMLMRSNKVNLLYDQVFAKAAAGPATPWHNDLPYWPVRGGPVISVWLALDAVKFESGALEFIAGSHRWNRWFQPFMTQNDGSVDAVYAGTDAIFEPLPDFEAERDQHTILCWEMAPGDVLVFDALVVHGARANRSGGIRRGYAVRYAGDGATYHTSAEVNPRITNPTLQQGQALDSAQYPVACRR